jgi:hypothetical protein
MPRDMSARPAACVGSRYGINVLVVHRMSASRERDLTGCGSVGRSRRYSEPMPAKQPEDMPAIFETAFNTGDIEQVLALYEADAVMLPQPGQVVRGADAIRRPQRSRSDCVP